MDYKKQVAASVIIIQTQLQRTRKKRKVWVKEWLKKRTTLSHMNLLSELKLVAEDYRNYLRMDEDLFITLLEKMKPLIQKKNTLMRDAVTAEERLICTLRYLARGRSLEDLKFSAVISPQALGRIIPETCIAIFNVLLADGYIKFPSTEEEWLKIARDFNVRWNFPNRGGAIDGKHVRITKPINSGSYYYNYKEYFSVVLMAIVNANYEFISVNVGTNGRVSDGGVIENTTFHKKLISEKLNLPKNEKTAEHMNFVFIADDAFALHKNLIKPYPFKGLSKQKRIYNYRLSRARRVVENAFGIMANRFRIFHTAMNLKPEKIDNVILAACALHNFLRIHCKSKYTGSGSLDVEDTENRALIPGEWRKDEEVLGQLQQSTRNSSDEAKGTRDLYCTFFNSTGAVPWQEDMI
ncbi:hypothetical protein PPYR_02280 [Photinus pyralis]|uniref:DDE Tnp4 domain-containing protein n=1 Tax=Photinus pyralis TaxID=7054 RepID=A0A5N4B7H9_PHOPY|nr:uncharacterized protein LOC116160234 [Photinus pyralis]KAB0805310.1 hypothetical protein PPYR_02280 [Photinus pyralis]